ncbi:unnamed protein product [Fusarium venenatum]|uniref:Uncharacterized protein n=1 Tax=Fusarium venenatum TaxID=56646 RepID=A0A2L2TC00_9HYPO|nr:uncharacterized protein FVRRES_03971 [Fusarium venenatum]CEI67459.1 unnamed protein product [Fusarium venenatum]
MQPAVVGQVLHEVSINTPVPDVEGDLVVLDHFGAVAWGACHLRCMELQPKVVKEMSRMDTPWGLAGWYPPGSSVVCLEGNGSSMVESQFCPVRPT